MPKALPGNLYADEASPLGKRFIYLLDGPLVLSDTFSGARAKAKQKRAPAAGVKGGAPLPRPEAA